jgi:hypothetical protein
MYVFMCSGIDKREAMTINVYQSHRTKDIDNDMELTKLSCVEHERLFGWNEGVTVRVSRFASRENIPQNTTNFRKKERK